MSRITGLFYIRGKRYNLLRSVQHRISSGLRISEYSTAETEVEENTINVEKKRTKFDVRGVFQDLKLQNPKSSKLEYKFKSVNKTEGQPLSFWEFQQLQDIENVIKVINNFSTERTIQLLKYLAIRNFRSIKVLKVLSEKICNNVQDLDFMSYSNVFYCWAVLSFKDKTSLDTLSQHFLKENIKVDSKSGCISLLHSIGVLRYRNCELIDLLLKNIIDLKTSYAPQEFLSAFVTLALVNFMSPYGKIILKVLSEYEDVEFTQTKSYLNFVWASVLLNELSEKHISEVLSENYLNLVSILDASIGNNIPLFLKLQNINGAATSLMSSYSGPFLKKSFYRPLYSKSKSQFLSSVVDGLCHLFPKHGFLKTLKDTGVGFILDVECCLDVKGNPTSLSKKEAHSKVGLLLLDFNDVCIDEQNTLTGLSSFKQRILEANGYKVVLIPYSEYYNSLKLSEKKEYLKKKLKECTKVNF